MKNVILYLALFFLIFNLHPLFGQNPDDQIRIEGRANAEKQQDKPYVILISADGFRTDYLEKFNPKFLNKMRAQGVSAKSMLPSFPSITFPNHYTIVTGLLPSHHGVIGNQMYDPKTDKRYFPANEDAVQNPDWYGGKPIWSLAESQDLLTACFYWPGSEAPIAGYHPSYYFPYSEHKGIQERVNEVKKWLELPDEKRPHFITFYMPDIDQAGHRTGPDALETEIATQYVDASIEKLVKTVAETDVPVNFIFLSDHGMASVDMENPIKAPEIQSDSVKIVNSGVYVNIFIEDKDQIEPIYKEQKRKATDQYEVYLKKDVPKKYKFSEEHDKHGRIGDVVLMTEAPYFFTSYDKTPPMGAHGYLAEDTPDMETVFFAWGPNIQESKEIDSFKNIHLFPVLAELLGLDYDLDEIDGDDRLVEKILKP